MKILIIEDEIKMASGLWTILTREGHEVDVEYDVMNRGIKPQMKYSNKLNSIFTMVLGDNELETAAAKLKCMDSGEQLDIALDGNFVDNFSNALVAEMFKAEDMSL